MILSQRLREANGTQPGTQSGTRSGTQSGGERGDKPPAVVPRVAAGVDNGAGGTGQTSPLQRLKLRAHEALFARLGSRLYDTSVSEQELHQLVRAELAQVVAGENVPLSEDQQTSLVNDICDDVLGYGPIQRFLDDPEVTEIMVNSTQSIYVERHGKLERTDASFVRDDHLRQVIDRIVSAVGRRVDESSPMVDARLPDGSRVNAIIPPLAVDGPALTVRKFAKEAYTFHDMIEFGTLNGLTSYFLSLCVIARMNILITGGTGTGKTTMLNVVSSFIPADQRLVTIEDAVELQLGQPHVVRLEARPANIEGRGQIAIRDLVRNALRMRPDRIIVGEVRGGEALDMLQAMNTGHEGSLSTLHANSPRDAMARLETMVLMAGADLPLRAVREQIASAIDLVVHIARDRDGGRRVTDISEINGMESDVITLSKIYGDEEVVDATGARARDTMPTGVRPIFTDRLIDTGLDVPSRLFNPPVIQSNGWAR